jgi:multisubunit Na+/H+ antiporter MnhE subunit
MFLLALDAIIWIKYDPSYSIASISFGVVIGVVGLLVLYSSILLCKKELKN